MADDELRSDQDYLAAMLRVARGWGIPIHPSNKADTYLVERLAAGATAPVVVELPAAWVRRFAERNEDPGLLAVLLFEELTAESAPRLRRFSVGPDRLGRATYRTEIDD